MMKLKSILKKILILLCVFILAFGSKAILLVRLYDYNLVGPDPYLFYQYMIELKDKGYINDYDFNRYYPLGASYYNKNLVSYYGYFSLILINTFPSLLGLLNLFNIIPAAKNIDWLSANFTIPFFFAISAIIFFLFSKKILKNDILALISVLIFSITPLFTMRIIAFDTELGAFPFITASFLIYFLAIQSESEKNNTKKIILAIILILGIFLLYYLIKFVPNSDHLQTYLLLSLFFVTLFLYPIFKSSKEYYYTLLIFSTILARKGWGGWIIIPIIVGANEAIRFLIGKTNKEIFWYIFFIPYFSLLEYKEIIYRSFLEVHNLIIVVIPLLYVVEILFEKLKIFKAIVETITKNFEYLNKIDSRILNRIIIVLLGFILSLPITYKHFRNIISPYTDRMITSVAEFQKFSGLEYLRNYSFIGVLFSFIGLSYLLWNKKEIKQFILSLVSSSILFISLFFLDHFISLELATTLAWISVFFLIIPIIVFTNKEIDENELLIITISVICLIIGKYIYRLAFFSGFSISLLFVNSLRWLENTKIKKKIVESFLEILTNIIFLLTSATAIDLFIKGYINLKIIAFPILIPIAIYIYYILSIYIIKTKEFNLSYLQYSILLLPIYGFYNYYGYITNYFTPIYFGGTEDHIIFSMLYLNTNTEKDAVIHFWWDYGYYGRVIANRTVWLSGDNAYPYWNHLMGRYGLAGNNFIESLELFYVHSVYDYKTFKILEVFNKNDIFYKYLYKKLNLTEVELKLIKNIKNKLKENWITLLYESEKDIETLNRFNLTEEEKKIIEKLHKIKYLKPSYLYIDPTDIGKSYQFTRLGSDEKFDKHSWIVFFNSLIPEKEIGKSIEGVRVNINNEFYYLLAEKNRLSYFGNFLLDENIIVNNEKIPRCIPDLNVWDCGIIFRVDIIFNEPIVEIKQLRKVLIEENINPWNIINATAYIFYRNKIYNISLGCVYFDGVLIEFDNFDYNGCLYVMPSLNNERIFSISSALFISQKSRNYTWVKLYFFNKGEPYFSLISYFYPNLINMFYNIPPLIYREIQPAKIWKIHYPDDFNVSEEKYCLYLATNLDEINKCSEIYNLRKYNSIWEV